MGVVKTPNRHPLSGRDRRIAGQCPTSSREQVLLTRAGLEIRREGNDELRQDVFRVLLIEILNKFSEPFLYLWASAGKQFTRAHHVSDESKARLATKCLFFPGRRHAHIIRAFEAMST